MAGAALPLLLFLLLFFPAASPMPYGGSAITRSKLPRYAAVFGGNYYTMPPASCWLVWDKENTGDFADCELAWTNYGTAARLKRHMWNGMLRKGKEQRIGHPTQKPLDVIKWAITKCPGEPQTIIDPFMGSGTTLRAAKDLGRQCVGIEKIERYCEMAAKRLAQGVLGF